eukprot:1653916-Amphidinium_carterae.1
MLRFLEFLGICANVRHILKTTMQPVARAMSACGVSAALCESPVHCAAAGHDRKLKLRTNAML